MFHWIILHEPKVFVCEDLIEVPLKLIIIHAVLRNRYYLEAFWNQTVM